MRRGRHEAGAGAAASASVMAAAIAIAVGLVIAACSGRAGERGGAAGAASATASASATATGTGTGTATATATATAPGGAGGSADRREPVALVLDPAALAEVAAAGGALEALVSDEGRAVIRRVIEEDVRAARRADPKAGVGIRGNPHRLFDVRWLERGRFELVGVAPRLDRIPMTGSRCGDLRLVYRLAYTAEVSGEAVSSRLPMTLAVVLQGRPADGAGADRCRSAAARWMAPPDLAGAALGRWLLGPGGPLEGQLAAERVTLVHLNAQLVRWPSAVRPDLGGHAEYVMRSLRPGPDRHLEPSWTEEMPDPARIRRDPARRARLLAWLREPATLDAIEAGTAVLPAELLATRAVSVAPRGLSRRANRPFRQILRPDQLDAELGAEELRGRRIIGSPEALLRRLDDLTCVGCHQSRTIAGFHLLGEDGPDAAPGNALAVSISVPLEAERRRRARLTRQLAAGEPVDFTRPMSERADDDPGRSGARCGLGDPGFAGWTCAEGFTCARLDAPDDDGAVGVCVPEGGPRVGDACEIGPLRPAADPHRDRVARRTELTCTEGVCNGNRVGFPAGMCTASCEDLPGGGACGVIALLTPFNDCLARKTPFPRCLAEHVRPAGLRACSAAAPCREDYICARAPGDDGSGEAAGTCIPPYFLFQLRVDGHP